MHVAERERLYEEAHPETAYSARPGRAGKSRKVCDNSEPSERFTSDTARKTGTSERKVQLDASRGEKIEGMAWIVCTSLDKGAIGRRVTSTPPSGMG